MKNAINNSGLLHLFALLAIVFTINIFSMRMTEKGKRAARITVMKMQPQVQERKLQQERESQYEPGKYFIYEQNTSNGILVDAEMVKQNCKSIKVMVEDMGMEPKEIPLDCPVKIIKLVFGILDDKIFFVDIHSLSLKELADVANVLNYLDVPADKIHAVLMRIKKEVIDISGTDIINNKILKQLNPDLQKLLMTESAVSYLKDCIINKYAKDRGKTLMSNVNSVGFSFDDKSFVSGGVDLVLWHISNSNNITHQVLVSNQATNVLACSPDSKHFVSTCHGNENNFILWDISNPSMITQQVLIGHSDDVLSVAFSSDGKKIISGGKGDHNNLILWNLSDQNNITHQGLIGHTGNVSSVAFSSDDMKIVSGGYGNENNFILWDISDLNNVTHQALEGHQGGVSKVIFSSDGKSIVSIISNSLILWDISNQNNITHKVLQKRYVISVALSSDGKKIISGSTDNNGKDNLRLWDISNQKNITHQKLVGLPHSVSAVAFSPDNKRIVAGCWNLNDSNNLILCDISNPNNIDCQKLVGQPHAVEGVGFSPDGKRVAAVGGFAGGHKFVLWTFLTDHEESLLKQINNCSVDQVRLIYQLCLQSLKGQTIALTEGSQEHAIFMTLPQDMQKLLTDLLFPKGWFSGWW